MIGYKRLNSFIASCFGFTLALMLLTIADYVALFVLTRFVMRLIMAQLIGYVPGWGEAKASGKNGRTYFAGNKGVAVITLYDEI